MSSTRAITASTLARKLLATLSASILIAGSLTAGALATVNSQHQELTMQQAEAAYYGSLGTYKDARANAHDSLRAADVALDTARLKLTTSEGKTLDNEARGALVDLIQTGQFAVAEMNGAIATAEAVYIAAVPSESASKDVFVDGEALLNNVTLAVTTTVTVLPDALTEPMAAVDAAVVAWEVEQARLAAEAEAKRKAEAEAQARAAAAAAQRYSAPGKKQSSSNGGSSSGSSSGVYTKHVWTAGFQKEIDQCRGAVSMTAAYANLANVVAEHKHCGGASFPDRAGTIVNFTGLVNGTYRVIGVVANLNVNVHNAGDIPRGYDLLFQTCYTDSTNMRFVALERIG